MNSVHGNCEFRTLELEDDSQMIRIINSEIANQQRLIKVETVNGKVERGKGTLSIEVFNAGWN